MSKKSPRIAALLAGLPDGPLPAHYRGWFECFNRQLYYEAHDVLEELWLQDRRSPDHAYYKGLIQAAGAFVHMQKHHRAPGHAVHGRRLSPASRLIALALANFAPYCPRHQGLDVDAFCAVLTSYRDRLEAGRFQINPWSPETAPTVNLSV